MKKTDNCTQQSKRLKFGRWLYEHGRISDAGKMASVRASGIDGVAEAA